MGWRNRTTNAKNGLDRLTILLLVVAAICVLGLLVRRFDHGPVASANITGSDASNRGGRVASFARELGALAVSPGVFFRLTSSGDSVGQSDADVVIVVFSDFTCGHCAAFQSTLETLMKRFPDEVLLIYKHFSPAGTGGTLRLDLAADCAGDQGRYLAYASAAFGNPMLAGSRDGWMQLADTARVPDMTRFVACTKSEQRRDRIDRAIEEAGALRVTGTPTSFINGVRIVGDLPLATLDTVVAFELGRLRPRAGT